MTIKIAVFVNVDISRYKEQFAHKQGREQTLLNPIRCYRLERQIWNPNNSPRESMTSAIYIHILLLRNTSPLLDCTASIYTFTHMFARRFQDKDWCIGS